jgi:hypothetical protein
VADIFLPAVEDLPKALATMPVLEGTIRDFSDSGAKPRVFAVIEIALRHSLVVPLEKLRVVESAEPMDSNDTPEK